SNRARRHRHRRSPRCRSCRPRTPTALVIAPARRRPRRTAKIQSPPIAAVDPSYSPLPAPVAGGPASYIGAARAPSTTNPRSPPRLARFARGVLRCRAFFEALGGTYSEKEGLMKKILVV